MRFVWGIREALCFKADSTSCRECSSVCAFKSIQPVSGIKLYTGFGGVHFHDTSAFRVFAGSSKVERTVFYLVQYIAVVVAGTENQLLEFVIDTFAYGMRSAEIHRSAFYFGNFSSRDGNFVDGRIEISVDSDNVVVDGRSRVGDAGEVKETMVSQINHCGFVCCSTVFDSQCVYFVFQTVSHFYFQVAGESFFAIGRNIVELHCALVKLYSVPYTSVETGRSSMQGIRTVVDGEFMFFAEQCEFSFGDTVAIASDGRAQERFRAVDDVVDAVVSEDYIGILTVFVRYHDRKNGASVIGYSYFHSLCVFEDK